MTTTGGEVSDPIRTPAWEWLLCGVLLSATLLNYADRQTLPVASVRIKGELGLNNEQYGRVEGIFGLAFGAGALFSGVLADRFSVRWLYPALMLLWSGAGIASGFCSTFASLWLSRLALGLFEAGHWPCALRTTQRVFAPARRPLANSILQAGAPLGAILPSLIMLAVVRDDVGSWRQIFWYVGLLGVPWVVAWLATVRSEDLARPVFQTVEDSERPDAPMEEIPFLRLLITRRFLLLVVMVVCINTCWHYIRVWMPAALQEHLGFSSDQVQQFFIVYWLATFAGSLVSGWLTGLLASLGWAVHRARMSVFLLFSLLTSLTLLAAFLPVGRMFITVMLLIGFGSLGLFPIYYSLNQELSARNQGKVGGSLGFATWFLLFFIHPAIGRLMDDLPESRPYVFAAVGMLPILSWGVVSVLWGRRPARAI